MRSVTMGDEPDERETSKKDFAAMDVLVKKVLKKVSVLKDMR